MEPQEIRVARSMDESDKTWLAELWQREWGADFMISKGRRHDLRDLSSWIAWDGDVRIGAATFHVEGKACELLSVNATLRGRGAGTALLRAVEDDARG